MPRAAAAAASSSIGSISPVGKQGADPTSTMVESSTAAIMASTSARPSAATGTLRSSMAKYWQAFSKAA